MNTNSLHIKPNHLEITKAILKKHVLSDVNIWIFGSRTTKNIKTYSDLDIALQHKSNETIPLKTIASLKADFIDSDLPWKVDVIDYKSVSGLFKKNIDETKIILT